VISRIGPSWDRETRGVSGSCELALYARGPSVRILGRKERIRRPASDSTALRGLFTRARCTGRDGRPNMVGSPTSARAAPMPTPTHDPTARRGLGLGAPRWAGRRALRGRST
jgi:hypothetical protein